jgi:hypothetical protein
VSDEATLFDVWSGDVQEILDRCSAHYGVPLTTGQKWSCGIRCSGGCRYDPTLGMWGDGTTRISSDSASRRRSGDTASSMIENRSGVPGLRKNGLFQHRDEIFRPDKTS